MADRRAILHIGTHKTGVTSIQRFLLNNTATLARGGVYVPASPHRRIAQGLMEGTDAPLREAIEESLGSGTNAMIVSSEELHLLHARPAMLAQLRGALEESGYDPFIVVYLRAQAAYVESIFCEVMKGVLHARFRPFVETALVQELAYVHPRYPVPLRYTTLTNDFASAFGADRIIARPFDPTRKSTHLIDDFLQTIERVRGPVGRDDLQFGEPRLHQRFTLGEIIVQAHELATQLYPDVPDPLSVVHRGGTTPHDPVLGEPFHPLLRDEHLAFIERFAPDNAAIERTFSIVLPGTRPEELAPPGAPCWALAAAQRRILDFALDTWFRDF